ncbi:MAG: hypothetical protein IT331_01000 [Anaerolineae bacterium]|nr:hypothetical protein [Anaerolineae bacterium]
MNVPRFSNLSRTWVLVIVLGLAALGIALGIYQFAQPAAIDVGSGRDAPFVQGFSFRENLPDGSNARWSSGRSEIRFIGLGAQDGTLTLRFAAPRPANPAQLQVLANGKDIAREAPGGDFQAQTFIIGRDTIGLGGDLVVALDSDTFSQPPDTRQLGLLVDSARFESTGAPVIPSPRVMLYFPALVILVFAIGLAWSGDKRVAVGASVLTLLLGAYGLLNARLETAYFLAPIFWTGLGLFGAAWVLVVCLQRLAGAANTLPIEVRTLRLMFVVMTAAFVFEFVLATGPGFIVDVQDYVVWSYKTVTYGLGAMYLAPEGLWISDQSPGLNYILHVVGLLYRAVFAPDMLYPAVAGDPALRGLTDNPAMLADPIHRTLLRLPMLFSDVVTGAVIFVTARRYLATQYAWLVALAFWFNPAVLWNGAYWGQTDAMHSLLVLICFLLIVFTPRVGLAFFVLGIAAFTKPQAMFFGPLLLLGAYRVAQWRGVVRALIFGAIGAAALLLPVILTGGGPGLVAYLLDAVGHHPILSANAHNLWWVVFHDDVAIPDTAALFPGAPLSYRTFSILLFALAYLVALVRAWGAPLERYFAYGAFVAFSFFIFPTEIHENYGYALLPLLAVAMARDLRLAVLYAALSVTMTLNYALHDPPIFGLLGTNNPHRDLALARWLNAVANVTIATMWVLYLAAPRGLNVPLQRLFLRHKTTP